MGKDPESLATIEQEELRGISRSVAEIEWLLVILVLLYFVFDGTAPDEKGAMVVAMVLYTGFVMSFRYAGFFRRESRWKLAVETWVMTGFITWVLMHTGRMGSPLMNCYLLVIITSALALGKLTTLLQLALIGACLLYLGDQSLAPEQLTLKMVGGLFAQFAPFVLITYITTMFASDIRYGLNRVKLLAETDELTATLNRRGFVIIADRLFGQAQRYKKAMSVLAIDCDSLKQVNDRYGHKAGDELLVSLVRSIQAQLRLTDVLARFGGDEFVALLPETPGRGALHVAERIRAAVAASQMVLGGKVVNTTVSIGIAVYPHDGITLDVLLARADEHMYRAKVGGRNRVAGSSATAVGDAPAPPVEEDAGMRVAV